MSWVPDLIQNTFESIYKIFTFFLYPYYEKKYFQNNKTVKQYLHHMLGYFALWLVIALVYCVVFYVFIIKAENKNIFDQLSDFITRPILDIFHEIYLKISDSIWANGFFVYIFYQSVTSYAQKQFLSDHFVHHKASGLIKVIKIGNFNSQSHYCEQNLDKVRVGREHIYDLVEDEEHENITIICASGWDFFGNATKSEEVILPDNKKQTFFQKQYNRIKKSFSNYKKNKNLDNGYLLKFLSLRNKHFSIMLLDPKSEASSKRASTYLQENSHKVIENTADYSNNINEVLKNIAKHSKNNSHVKVKLLNVVPAWKIVKIDKEIWAQPIISGARSDHTMLYGYKNSPHSKYHTYFNKIEDLWNNNAGSEIDLNAYRCSDIKSP